MGALTGSLRDEECPISNRSGQLHCGLPCGQCCTGTGPRPAGTGAGLGPTDLFWVSCDRKAGCSDATLRRAALRGYCEFAWNEHRCAHCGFANIASYNAERNSSARRAWQHRCLCNVTPPRYLIDGPISCHDSDADKLGLLRHGAGTRLAERERQGTHDYLTMCAACHAVGATDSSPHSDAPPFRKLEKRLDLDLFVDRLRENLTSGHPDMPTFRFTREDAQALVAYLRSIQGR